MYNNTEFGFKPAGGGVSFGTHDCTNDLNFLRYNLTVSPTG
jgi:hypothetical protein